MLWKSRSMVLTVFMAALVSGIRADQETDLRDIRRVICAAHMSVIKGREQEFLSHFILPKEVEAYLKAAFQYQQEVIAFEDALKKKLGAGALEQFKRIKVSKSFEPTFLPRDTDWVANLKIEVEKGQATFKDPHTGATTTLMLKDGVWKISLAELGGDPAETQRFYEEVRQIVTWAKEQVEKGEDLQRIKTEMGERFWSPRLQRG